VKKYNKISDRIRNNNLYKKTFKHKYLALFLLLIIILITYNYFSHGFIYDITKQDLQSTIDFIKSFGELSWLIYLLTIILEVIIAPISSIILNIAGSVIFGSFIASMLTIIATFVGNTIAFFIAKNYGHAYLENLISKEKQEIFHSYSNKYGPFFLFILRLNPITSTDLFSYLAGIIGMKFKNFIISTMLGVIPMILFLSYFGEVILKDNPFLKLLFIIITMIYIIIFLYFILKVTNAKLKNRLNRS